MSESLAPGSRVRVRDEEWAVEKCLPLPAGGYAVHVRGLSELVRAHRAIFIDQLDDIEPLRPEDTLLVEDDSTEYRQTRLYIETLLRRTPPTDSKIHIGHRSAIDVMDYQFVPARRALGEATPDGHQCIRPRILIADGTGLGKTIEAGILLSELIKRGRGRRILVVATKALLAQFQRDLWARFTIPLVRLDSEGIRRVQAKIPSNRNPFSYYDRCIISVDTLKNNGRYRAELEQIRWDVIVVDECQNVANSGSQRESLARLLAAQCESLILTSATPHNGRPESFANLMRMLDPTAIADEYVFGREDIEHLFVRRFKKDVERQAKGAFQKREVVSHPSEASTAERIALEALRSAELHSLGRKQSRIDKLFTWTLLKAFLSSPHAALESLDNRITTTQRAIDGGRDGRHPHATVLESDLGRLSELRGLVEAAATGGAFTKLERLFAELAAQGIDGSPTSPRVVIFSERIRTLELLKEELTKRFRLKNPAEVIGVFEGSEIDTKLAELKESFGREGSSLRILLASDAASEGINLHYHCNQLFHFDIPWSLIRLTQRNGRIDRFGQKKTPYLHYLLTHTDDATADQTIVERLIEREQVVYRQLGDAGALMGLYDAEAEADFITRGAAKGKAAAELIPDAPRPAGAAERELEGVESAPALDEGSATDDGDDVDLFAILDGSDETPANVSGLANAETNVDVNKLLESIAPPRVDSAAIATGGLPSLFSGDFDLTVTAIRLLEDHPLAGSDGIVWDKDDETQSVRIAAPEPFASARSEFLPAEAIPEGNQRFQLVARHEVVREKIRQALESDDGRWPEWQLLWEQHPLVDWLLDTLAAVYARHEAPVLLVPALRKTSLFLFSTLVSNEDSQPVYTSWFALEAAGGSLTGHSLTFEECLEATGLQGGIPNPSQGSSALAELRALVPAAVDAARAQVDKQREPIVGTLRKRARKEARRLQQWEQRVGKVIQAQSERYLRGRTKLPPNLREKIERRREHVALVKANHENWISSLQAHGGTHVRLVAVFTGA